MEMWSTCYRKHTCTDRRKIKQKKPQENQRFSAERAGWSEENIGSSKVALLWRMHVPVMLLKSSYDLTHLHITSLFRACLPQAHVYWLIGHLFLGVTLQGLVRFPRSKLRMAMLILWILTCWGRIFGSLLSGEWEAHGLHSSNQMRQQLPI